MGSHTSWEGGAGGGACSGLPMHLVMDRPGYHYEAHHGSTQADYPDDFTLFGINAKMILVFGTISASELILTMDGVTPTAPRVIHSPVLPIRNLLLAVEAKGFKIRYYTPPGGFGVPSNYSILVIGEPGEVEK